MPPKAAPVVAAPTSKEGGKIIYITCCLLDATELKVVLNPTCRLDILLDAAKKALLKEVVSLTASVNMTLQASTVAVAAEAGGGGDGGGEEASGSAEEVVKAKALLARLQEMQSTLQSTTVNNMELQESGSANILNVKENLAKPASDILRPSGVFKIGLLLDGTFKLV